MWMSEARRSRAVKMVVSTRRIMGLMSSSLVSFSMEMFSSGVVVAGEHVEGEALAGFIEHALRLLGFLEQVGDLRERGHAGNDAVAEQAGDLVEHHQARGVADGYDQRVLLLLDGHEVVAEHELDGDGAQQFVLNLEVFEVDELGVIAVGESLSLGALVGLPAGAGRAIHWYRPSGQPPTSRSPARAKRWAGRARSK